MSMKKLNISYSRHKNGFLYCQIYFDSTKANFSTGIKVNDKEWLNGKPKGKNSVQVQKKLGGIKADLQKCFDYLKMKNEHEQTIFTPQELKDFYLKKHINNAIKHQKSVLDILSELTESKLSEGIIKPQSKTRSQTKINNIKRYFESIYNLRISFDEIDYSFLEKMIKFLREENFTTKKIQSPKKNTYLKKYIQFLTEGNEYALQKGYCSKMIPKYRKFKSDASETHYLMMNELKDLINLDLSKHNDSELSKVRDLFVFMAYTGFLWSDCLAFKPKEHIITSNDGTKVFAKPRVKTGSYQHIPVFLEAKSILERYDYQLPLGTEQIYNRKIKILCEMVGVPNAKTVTMRSGRRTAGMIWLYSGIRLEVVSKMLGHKNISTTQRHYAKILNESVLAETAHLINIPQETPQVPNIEPNEMLALMKEQTLLLKKIAQNQNQ
ncbi:hypothetical protein AD998_18305 [bacterium 336/3]|nr:hypothetical protein AD998_18305 [bacterium 336/3]